MTSFNISANSSFAELVVENQRDPQWVTMIQSLVNYKKQLEDEEINKKIDKEGVRKFLVSNYKLHTLNGKQFIRIAVLRDVLNVSKIAKRHIEHVGFIEMNKIVNWIYNNEETISKRWLKNNDFSVC